MQSTLKEFMPKKVLNKLGKLPTYHSNCILASRTVNSKGTVIIPGVARPGKTARDRVKKAKNNEDLC